MLRPGHAGAPVDGQVLVLRDGLPAGVVPEEVAGGGVEGLHAAPAGHEHDAAAHEGRDLVGARLHRPGPDELEVAHIVPVDLVQRAVALAVQGPAPVDPVAVVRGQELLRHDGLEVRHLGAGGGSEHAEQQHRDDQSEGCAGHFVRSLSQIRPDEPGCWTIRRWT